MNNQNKAENFLNIAQNRHNTLIDAELAFLGEFLDENNDKGCMSLTQTHGFLTGALISLNIASMEELLPEILGQMLEVVSDEDAMIIIEELYKLCKDIIDQLGKNEKFVPLLWERSKTLSYDEVNFDNQTLIIWCKSFLKATKLDPAWKENEGTMLALMGFSILSNEFDLKGSTDSDGNVIQDDTQHKKSFKDMLPEIIIELFTYWKSFYEMGSDEVDDELNQPYYREQKKLNRNESCPCGSGKKYKKCCLHSESLCTNKIPHFGQIN